MKAEEIHEDVKNYYRRAAETQCCIPGDKTSSASGDRAQGTQTAGTEAGATAAFGIDERWGTHRYDTDTLSEGTAAAAQLSMGCGNPYLMADLHPGEIVLDLGSGGGLDVILSAKRVGPTGKAYGVDFLDEMLELAATNAAEAGVDNVEFLNGMIESVPLPDQSVDVVISNCVINLAPDKAPVFAEIARVLRPGGRVAISDVVADDGVGPSDNGEAWADCGEGALQHSEYIDMMTAAGLDAVTIEFTHDTGPGRHGAIVRATRS